MLSLTPLDLLSSTVEERKLFVGMVSKKHNENDVRVMFSSFGTIEECHVLRDTSGNSRGKLEVFGTLYLLISVRVSQLIASKKDSKLTYFQNVSR